MPVKGLQDWQPMEAEVLLQHAPPRHAPEVQAELRVQALPGGSEAGSGGVGLGVGVGELEGESGGATVEVGEVDCVAEGVPCALPLAEAEDERGAECVLICEAEPVLEAEKEAEGEVVPEPPKEMTAE